MRFIITLIIFSVAFTSCKKEGKEYPNTLEGKIENLKDLKTDQSALNAKIAKLQTELEKLDPSRGIKPKLVSTMELAPEGFNQYINLQGTVYSDNISYVAPRNGMGGYVKQSYVKEGQFVKSGQLLLRLDDSVLRQAIEGTRTQLGFAQNIYNKTKGLWDQNIGTEVQLLAAKNNVEALEKQIAVQEEQLKTYLVYADQSGIADKVSIKVGEMFTGLSMAGPQIQIVNNNNLSVKVDIPETYAAKVKSGAKVVIEIPSLNKTFNTTISNISQSINAASRGFTAECKIPSGLNIKPNMAATAKILNHTSSKAIVIPINTVQSDEKSKYVFVMQKDTDGKFKAKRKTVVLGALNGEDVEILEGIAAGDELVTVGYQNLYEGQLIAK